MRSARLVVVAGLLGALGCATAGRAMFKEPVVTLKDVAVSGVGMSGGAVDVVLSVYNPNGFNLDATRLTYNLMVDSTRFGSGVVESRFIVQKNDSAEVRIPVNFTWTGLGAAARSLFDMGMVNYRVMGDVTVRTDLGNYTIPYDRTGRFTTTGRN